MENQPQLNITEALGNLNIAENDTIRVRMCDALQKADFKILELQQLISSYSKESALLRAEVSGLKRKIEQLNQSFIGLQNMLVVEQQLNSIKDSQIAELSRQYSRSFTKTD